MQDLPFAAQDAALLAVRARIADACARAGRATDEVTLVAVSKTHPVAAIEAALAQGQRVFGENRVQEAVQKFSALRELWPGMRLHLIGALQTNKAEEAVRAADTIETLDRPKLADALARAADRAGRLPDLLVQVNIGGEEQKSGVAPEDADGFIETCQTRFGARLRGVMCIPPAHGDPAPFFARLAEIRRAHGLPVLSMGMSGDFETAILCGATHVRVGSAIFGRARVSTLQPFGLQDGSGLARCALRLEDYFLVKLARICCVKPCRRGLRTVLLP